MPIPKALRNNYILSGEEKLRTLDRLWRNALAEGSAPESLKPVMDFSHKLAGSGGSYGFDELGDAARHLETAILSEMKSDEITDAYSKLRKRLEALAASPLE